MAGVERADAEVPRGELGLQRVQDVVDFHEVLLGGFADVFGGQLDLFEAVNVAIAQVDLGLAGGQQFGNGPGDAGGVGDPDGFGHEEAVELLGLAHQGSAVGGEGEDAVEAILDFAFRAVPAAAAWWLPMPGGSPPG